MWVNRACTRGIATWIGASAYVAQSDVALTWTRIIFTIYVYVFNMYIGLSCIGRKIIDSVYTSYII